MKQQKLLIKGRKKQTPGYNPRHESYAYYGARGIKVCDKWRRSFEAFFRDMGPRPSSDHSLDRILSTDNYQPGRVRWATWAEQAATRSANHEAMSAAGKKSASLKKIRKREAIERAGQLVLFAPSSG